MKFRWDKKYLYWGITAFCVVVGSFLVIWALGKWRSVVGIVDFLLSTLAPIITGLVIAYLLNPLLRFFERALFVPLFKRLCKKERRVRSFARSTSIMLTLGLLILLIAVLLALVLPELYYSLEKLVTSMPEYLDIAVKWVQGLFDSHTDLETTVLNILENVTSFLTSWLENSVLPQADALLASISSGVLSVLKGVVNFLIGLIVSVYVMFNKEKFQAQGRKLLCALFKPKAVSGILRNLRQLHKSFGEYFSGVLISSSIIGVLCAVFLLCFKMPYAALIAVLIAVTNIIPFLGPYIGAIPSAFLILLESPLKALIFVVFIVVLQFFEGNILSTKILGIKTGLSGFWIVFAILLGGGLFGFVGMVCAVPLFSFLYFLLRNFCNRRLVKRQLPTDTAAYRGFTGEEAPKEDLSDK